MKTTLKIKNVLIVSLLWLLFLTIDLMKKTGLDFESNFFQWYYLPGFLIWIGLTFPLKGLFAFTADLRIWKRVGCFLVLGPAFGILKVILNRGFHHALSGYFDVELESAIVGGNPFYYVEATIIVWVQIIIFYVIEVTQKYKEKKVEAAQLESALAQAHLETLKMQLHPHFLFNAHNAIATMMRANQNEEALEMLLKLSGLLRTSLNNFENQVILLGKEVRFIQQYLDIEKIRFEDRLQVTFDIPTEVEHLEVPVFVLQPLIENSIKHGVNKSMGPSSIEISARKSDEQLKIRVLNTGQLQDEPLSQNGIGLNNTRNRLENLYGAQASLTLEELGGMVEATLFLPINTVD